MKLGINTYTYMWSIGFELNGRAVQPAQPLTALGLLDKAHELRVSVVQLGPNLPFDRLPEAEQAQFIASAQSWNFTLEHGTRGLETDHLERQAALAKKMGAKLLRTVPEINGQDPPLESIPGLLKAIVPCLEREGINLGLENGKIPAADLRRILDELDHPQVGVVLDMVNSLAVPEGWKEVTRELAKHVLCLHFKDFVVQRHWSMMGFICEGRPAGKGQIDTRWLLEALKASRHEFNVIIELWTPEQENIEATAALEQAWARQSVDYLRRFIQD